MRGVVERWSALYCMTTWIQSLQSQVEDVVAVNTVAKVYKDPFFLFLSTEHSVQAE